MDISSPDTSSDRITVSDMDTYSQVLNNNIDSSCALFDVNSSSVDCDSLMKRFMVLP